MPSAKKKITLVKITPIKQTPKKRTVESLPRSAMSVHQQLAVSFARIKRNEETSLAKKKSLVIFSKKTPKKRKKLYVTQSIPDTDQHSIPKIKPLTQVSMEEEFEIWDNPVKEHIEPNNLNAFKRKERWHK